MIYSTITPILIYIVVFLSTCYGVSLNVDKYSSTWLRNITVKNVEDAIKYSTDYASWLSQEENNLYVHGTYVKPGSLSYKQAIDSKPSKDGLIMYRRVEMISEVSSYMVQNHCNSQWDRKRQSQCAKDLKKIKLNHTDIEGVCVTKDYYNICQCQKLNMKYRGSDGSCNNLKHVFNGKVNTAYRRITYASYRDRLSTFDDNPNARKLSTNLVNNAQAPDRVKTFAMAYWAIFISHDLSHTVVSSMLQHNTPIECCRQDGRVQYPMDRHPLCAPIIIPDDDKFFSRHLHRCMNYVRSATTFRTDCTFGHIEQMNDVTHYLDASTVYGSNEAQTLSLRRKVQGELLSFRSNTGEEYMPLSRRPDECSSDDERCFETGDVRANSLPHLTVMHTLWLREHNRVARQLSVINIHWDDQRIFQEARKIIIAYVQHITYNEWLPILLGGSLGGSREERELLETLESGYSKLYDEEVDPTISNSFATAILPFTNSMLSDHMILYSENRTEENVLSLMEAYSKPIEKIITAPGFFSGFIRGLATQNTEKIDMHFTEIVTNYLYHNGSSNNSFGMDIVSLIIQRSRDHGIPKYRVFRKYCGLRDIQSYEDLKLVLVEGAADKLLTKFTYKSWNEIDLFIGALFEIHDDNAMVGPTISCMIREQFIRTRRGDRYFYDLPNIFNENQLEEIRKVTLARIFCNNGNNVVNMQQNVFYKPRADTDLQSCSLIPSVNLDYWREYQ